MCVRIFVCHFLTERSTNLNFFGIFNVELLDLLGDKEMGETVYVIKEDDQGIFY